MPTGNHSVTMQVAGIVFSRNKTLSADQQSACGDGTTTISVPAGKTVTTWAKTDGDTASCVLPSGHGYTSGTFDVYDSDGNIIRYGVTGTVAGNNLSLDGGTVGAKYPSGFPASLTTGIVVCKCQQVNITIDGDSAVGVGVIMKTAQGHIDFQDSSSNSIRGVQLNAGEPDCWDNEQQTNPYTGEIITKAMISNGSGTTAGILQIGVLQDSTIWPSSSPSSSVSSSPSATPSTSVSASPSASPSSSVSSSPSASPSSSTSSSPSSSVSSSPSASPSSSVSSSPSSS